MTQPTLQSPPPSSPAEAPPTIDQRDIQTQISREVADTACQTYARTIQILKEAWTDVPDEERVLWDGTLQKLVTKWSQCPDLPSSIEPIINFISRRYRRRVNVNIFGNILKIAGGQRRVGNGAALATFTQDHVDHNQGNLNFISFCKLFKGKPNSLSYVITFFQNHYSGDIAPGELLEHIETVAFEDPIGNFETKAQAIHELTTTHHFSGSEVPAARILGNLRER